MTRKKPLGKITQISLDRQGFIVYIVIGVFYE